MDIYYTLEGFDPTTCDWVQYGGTIETIASAKRLKKAALEMYSKMGKGAYTKWRIIKYTKIRTVLK